MAVALQNILRQRLRRQRLTHAPVASPSDVVRWLGAAQAQDYAGAKWAVGLRVPGLVDFDVEEAFNAGAILRTHVLRPTWHFLAREDAGWIVGLSAPRVHQQNASYYRQSGLDASVLARTRTVLERELGAGAFRTRAELASAFARARVPAEGQRLAYILMHAELERVICSGPRRGKQFTYALFDARARTRSSLHGDDALAELMRRYFQSHGPATVRDCVWWSGLTSRHVTRGLDALGAEVTSVRQGDRTFWSTSDATAPGTGKLPALLLPNYDEYMIAYKDRDLAVPAQVETGGRRPDGSVFAHQAVVGGELVGAWSRDASGTNVRVYIRLSRAITTADQAALRNAAAAYGTFLGRPVDCRFDAAKTSR